MNWISKLLETYENAQGAIGVESDDQQVPLLPICHTTQMAHIEIVLSIEGEFLRARIIPKKEARTIIPSTETAASRSGKKPAHFPLCDKLQYIAGDFSKYGGVVTSGFQDYPLEPFDNYLRDLEQWCSSPIRNEKVKAVHTYVKKRRLIQDLVEQGVLFVDENGRLHEKWDKGSIQEAPSIKQNDAFVRWVVEKPGDSQSTLWNDNEVFNSWSAYYLSQKGDAQVCYSTGKTVPIASQHPNKIRNDGDRAKLISSNDTTGFTFRGRFTSAGQAVSIGYETTQKAHSALRWLVSRQGYINDTLVIVAWSTTHHEIANPMSDTLTFLGIDLKKDEQSGLLVDTAQELAIKLNKKIAGFRSRLTNTKDVIVMGLDSAALGIGRLSIIFYRELTQALFYERIERWHLTCCWKHRYYSAEVMDQATGRKKRKTIPFAGAPSPKDIAKAAYGNKVDGTLMKGTLKRLLPCIIDGQKVPSDLVESAVHRASKRTSMEKWEWEKTLSIACALYKKLREKEEVYEMALERNRSTRDYLYGRLLALAENLEQWALRDAEANRPTTAARLMHRFADHPFSTWRTIELALGPYKARLGKKSIKAQGLISEVVSMFDHDDFINDRKLTGEFLLGYHCQRDSLWKKDTEKDSDTQSSIQKNEKPTE